MVAEAESARDDARRANGRLEAALAELEAQGLRRDQVRALLDLPGRPEDIDPATGPVSGGDSPSPSSRTP